MGILKKDHTNPLTIGSLIHKLREIHKNSPDTLGKIESLWRTHFLKSEDSFGHISKLISGKCMPEYDKKGRVVDYMDYTKYSTFHKSKS